MPIQQISMLPDAPTRQNPSQFSQKADEWIAGLEKFISEVNTFGEDVKRLVDSFGFVGSSETAQVINSESPKQFFIEPSLAFAVGQFVTVVSTTSAANYLVGQIIQYDEVTGALSINVTGFEGAGSHDDWQISLTLTSAEKTFLASEVQRATNAADQAEAFGNIVEGLVEFYDSVEDALSKGLASVVIASGGSGGSDGVFDISVSPTSGKDGVIRFTVSGGAVTLSEVLTKGTGFTTDTTIDISGLAAGASANVSIAPNRSPNQYFSLLLQGSTEREVYKVISSTEAVLINSYPSADAVNSVAKRVSEDAGSGFYFSDEFGFSVLYYLNKALSAEQFRLDKNGLVAENIECINTDHLGYYFTDGFGFCSLAVIPDTGRTYTSFWTLSENELSSTDFTITWNSSLTATVTTDDFGFIEPQIEEVRVGFSPADLAILDQQAVLASGLTPGANLPIPRIIQGYNHHLSLGQSLSTGQESWPQLTGLTDPKLDIYMVGDSPRPRSKSSSQWEPLGQPVLNTLKSVVQEADFSAIIEDETVALLAEGENRPAEQVEIAALVTLKRALLDWFQQDQDSNRKIIDTACGVGGQTIEALSLGASPDYFSRVTSAIDLVKALADADGSHYQVPAILHMQGEGNLGFSTKESFKAETSNYFSQIEVVATGDWQSFKPAFFTYQTRQTSVLQDLNIGQAQLEIALEKDNVFLASPHYPVTDKGTHLDANGSRWLGCYVGKVMRRVMIDRIDWKPLHCFNALIRDCQIVLQYSVPVPPLKFLPFYNGVLPTLLQHKGFAVFENGAEVPIEKVELQGSCCVLITLPNTPLGDIHVTYADGGNGRGGNLCDSDPYRAPFNYEYEVGSGQYLSSNIEELVGKPYPLNNFAVAQKIAIQEA